LVIFFKVATAIIGSLKTVFYTLSKFDAKIIKIKIRSVNRAVASFKVQP